MGWGLSWGEWSGNVQGTSRERLLGRGVVCTGLGGAEELNKE